MKSDEERISFVLRFVQTDLDGLREGDWLNLREDMVTFLGWTSRWRDPLTPKELIPLKDETAYILRNISEAFAPKKPGDGETRLPTVLRIGDIELKDIFKLVGEKKRGIAFKVDKINFLFFDMSEAGKLRLRIGASLRDAFFFSLLATLSHLDITYLRQCPVCSRLFYAEHGRQRFCSPQCASREGTARFRKKHREEENARGRKNYEKKVKNKLGPHVQIAKRTKPPKPQRKEE